MWLAVDWTIYVLSTVLKREKATSELAENFQDIRVTSLVVDFLMIIRLSQVPEICHGKIHSFICIFFFFITIAHNYITF